MQCVETFSIDLSIVAYIQTTFQKRFFLVQSELGTFCNEEPETIEYLFFEYMFTRIFWRDMSNFFSALQKYVSETVNLKLIIKTECQCSK